ncbi:MAG: Ig-like domain-containing protein, partial [Clostridia bacterium]|nr:Ig-like domain-containing protein [Clostridia bacterium]
MKRILSTALVLSLMLGTSAVMAETQTTDLIPLYDFNGYETGIIDDAGLAALGITASTDNYAEMSIVDLSGDETYGSLGKVLQYKPTSGASEGGAKTTSIEFPMSYELNANENLIVEYDMRYYAYSLTDWFNSSKWGNVGLSGITIDDGGNGKQLALVPRPVRQSTTVVDRRQYADGKTSSGNKEWLRVKIVYDYEEYQKYNVANDKTSKGITATVVNLKSGTNALETGTTATGWLNSTTAGNLTFNETSGVGLVQLDNIHVYTMPKFRLETTSTENNETGVFYDTEKITAEFTNDIENADTVSVKLNGVSIDGSLYTVTKSGKTITVDFNENLKYESEYTVDYTGITDVLGQTLSDTAITFTTEEAPDVQLGELKLTENIGSTYQTASSITAKNGLQGAELSLNNTAAEARNVSVIFAVYAGESRVLKDMIFTETT